MPTLNFCGWKSDSQLTVRGQKIDKKEKLASTFKSHRSHIGGGECCVWEFLTILDLSHKFFFRLVTFNLILDKIPKKPLFYSRRINLHFVNNKAIVFRIDIDKLPKILQNHYVVVETNCVFGTFIKEGNLKIEEGVWMTFNYSIQLYSDAEFLISYWMKPNN